jgi:hypothetical protein
MNEARRWVLEYGRRSRQFNEEAARAYLAKVKRLSPTAMRDWLAALNTRRANLQRSTEVTHALRQRSVDEAFLRLQAVREAQANSAQAQLRAALAARGQMLTQQQYSTELQAVRQAGRSDYLWNMYYSRDYGRMLAFPDRGTKIAAMYMLPGDLPPSDPRNFIRGDVPEPATDVVDRNGLPVAPVADAGAVGAGTTATPAGSGGSGTP